MPGNSTFDMSRLGEAYGEAKETGFRSAILEKAFHLLHLLESFLSHPYLKSRMVLKGGTVLN
ncbi:MAG: hypothetical protein KAS32_15360 [Candidatus Peribacteraceae bacterium]|nr:hypothetical protein [Candidatus Peribacteraceae bacterium]